MSLPLRLIKVIECEVGPQRRFKELEEITGIGVSSWRQVWNERQRPTAEMIEAVGKQWPQYAFWLATGITDPERGHVAPKIIDSYYPVIKGIEQPYATEEFRYLINRQKLEPIESAAQALRRREIEDSVLTMREKDILPAIYVSYEKVMRELGEPGKSEFFILESNNEIREIRKLRKEYEEKLQKPIKEWRNNLIVSKAINKLIQVLINPFNMGK